MLDHEIAERFEELDKRIAALERFEELDKRNRLEPNNNCACGFTVKGLPIAAGVKCKRCKMVGLVCEYEVLLCFYCRNSPNIKTAKWLYCRDCNALRFAALGIYYGDCRSEKQ